MSQIKKLSFSEAIKQSDSSVIGNGEQTTLKGLVNLRDQETGEIKFSMRKNLILLRGRTHALEKLFGDTIDNNGVSTGDNPYVSNLNRAINGFVVGRGGSVSASTPFEPKTVVPTDRWLTTEVPFRLHDSTSTEAEPSLFIPAVEASFYSDGRSTTDANQREYYMKRFDTFDPTWNFDATSNEVYKLITMSISADDCRTYADPMINELALVFSEELGTVDANGMPQFTDIEIFSKIHFPTEYLSDGKSLAIEYLVYA